MLALCLRETLSLLLKYLETFAIEPMDMMHPLVALKNIGGFNDGSIDSMV